MRHGEAVVIVVQGILKRSGNERVGHRLAPELRGQWTGHTWIKTPWARSWALWEETEREYNLGKQRADGECGNSECSSHYDVHSSSGRINLGRAHLDFLDLLFASTLLGIEILCQTTLFFSVRFSDITILHNLWLFVGKAIRFASIIRGIKSSHANCVAPSRLWRWC